MRRQRHIISAGLALLLILIGLAWSVNHVSAGRNDRLKGPVKSVLERYESIQKALAEDSMTGISETATAIAKIIRDDAGSTLPLRIATDAERLAGALDIKTARRAFKPLSAALIAWLEEHQVESSGYQEAYCPMADANWLQKEGQISNPYLGKKMLHCGEFDRRF